MDRIFNEVNEKLLNLISNTDIKNEDDRKRTRNYLLALSSHIDAVNRERDFSLTEEQRAMIKRGNVVWIDFGFNIGKEFGGRHPAIILRVPKNFDKITVVPLDSEPKETQALEKRIKKDYWVDIPQVHNMKKGRSWTNVLRMVDVSVIRIDLRKFSNAYIDRSTLFKIDNMIAKYQYKPCTKSQKALNFIDKSN